MPARRPAWPGPQPQWREGPNGPPLDATAQAVQALAVQQQQTNTALQQLMAVLTQQGVRAAAGSGGTPRAASSVAPFGTVWSAPFTIEEFNKVLGSMGLSGATPEAIILSQAIAPGTLISDPAVLQFPVPPGSVVLAFSNVDVSWSVHDAGLMWQGWIDYDTPGQAPLTTNALPGTEDYTAPLDVVGSHEITANITALAWSSALRTSTLRVEATGLIIDQNLWNAFYLPIFRKAQVSWVQDLVQTIQGN